MRNTKHKLFHDKSLKCLHSDFDICGIVRNHFLTEDFLEVKYEPKTGQAEGFDFGIKDAGKNFLTGSDG